MRIQYPASLGHEIARDSLVQRSANDLVHVELARRLVIRLVRPQIMMSEHELFTSTGERIKRIIRFSTTNLFVRFHKSRRIYRIGIKKKKQILRSILPQTFDSEYVHLLVIGLLYGFVRVFVGCVPQNVHRVALPELQVAPHQRHVVLLVLLVVLALQRDFQIDLTRLAPLAQIRLDARIRFHAVAMLPHETPLALDHQAFVPVWNTQNVLNY